MPDYTDHAEVKLILQRDQDADEDQREQSKDSHIFITKKDGMWHPFFIRQQNVDEPRMSWDMTTPVVDRVSGELDKMQFGINVVPNGGKSSVEIAKTYQGLMRNIQNISGSEHILSASARNMITGGKDGWEYVQQFVDGDSFDQDLMMVPIPNYLQSVWFDYGSTRQDRSDARHCNKVINMPLDEYNEKWPDRAGVSVDDDVQTEAYVNQGDSVNIAQLYYYVETERELVLYDNGSVYEDGPQLKKAKQELARLNVKEVKRRKRTKKTVWVHKYDGTGWLEPAEETVFELIPICETLGNYSVYENVSIYFGEVEKLMDPQRSFNFSISRSIAETSLAPRAKYFGTDKMIAAYKADIETLNTNHKPWQSITPDPEFMGGGPPVFMGGAQINPGLENITQLAKTAMGDVGGLFAPNMGDNPGLQSGVAVKELKASGNLGNVKYITSQEIAICYGYRVLLPAIPKVYRPGRQVKILEEDGITSKIVTIGEKIKDEQTGTALMIPGTNPPQAIINPETGEPMIDPATQDDIILNDLSQGQYSVTCVAGPSFKSKQGETVSAMSEIAGLDATVIAGGTDVLLNNIGAPGFDVLAKRARRRLLKAGEITPEEMTDEEKAEAQAAAQQPQQPDALMVAAQAEQGKADAAIKNVEIKEAKLELDFQEKSAKLRIEAKNLELKQLQAQIDTFKAQSDQENKQTDQLMAMAEQSRKTDMSIIDGLNTQADTLLKIRQGMGVESFTGPGTSKAFIDQAQVVQDAQEVQP